MSYPMKIAINPVSFPWNSSPFVNKKFTEQTVTIVTLNLEMQKRDHLFNKILIFVTFFDFSGLFAAKKWDFVHCQESKANSAPPPAPGPAKIPGPVLFFFFAGGFPRGIYRTWRHVLGRFTTGRPPWP